MAQYDIIVENEEYTVVSEYEAGYRSVDKYQSEAQLEKDFGKSFYSRKDTPATPEQKARVASISPESIKMTDLAGDKITAILTKAPGNGAAIGGIKICAEKSWAAIRPSGTENICKVYAESLLGQEHLEKVIAAASELL